MRLFLDTHFALWAVNDPERLPHAVRRSIEDADEVVVSVVVVWEIAIKHALRRKTHDAIVISGDEARGRFVEAGFTLLPVTAEHAAAVEDLPPLSGDPFDRMLVAQATIDGMRLMTRDARLKPYGAMVLVV